MKSKAVLLLYNVDLNKIWKLSFFLILGWFFSTCLLDGEKEFNPILLILLICFFFSFLLLFYKKLSVKFKNLSNKQTWIFYIIVVIVMTFLQLLIGYLVRTNPSWDLKLVIQSAQEMIQYGHSTDMAPYYIQAPNNILITLMIAFTIKFFSFFHLSNIHIITLLVNTLFIQFAILLLFKVAKKIYGNFGACFTLVLMFLFLPIYPYSTIMYTDTMSMFLPIGFLYLIMKLNDVKNNKQLIVYSLLLGLFSFISLNLKVTALIVVIAFAINEIIKINFKKLAKIAAIALCGFAVFEISFVTFIKRTNIIGIDYELTKSVPFTHFIMMGMYKDGAFDADEWQFTLRLPDYDTRKNENLRVIKERLKSYGTQGYIKFLNHKVRAQTWGGGTYDFETILDSYAADNNIAHKFLLKSGPYYKYIDYYCQMFHFTMILLILISVLYSIKYGKEHDILNIGKLSMFGLLIFLLMWETRSRYMLNFIPIYILIMSNGINVSTKKMKPITKMLFLKNQD